MILCACGNREVLDAVCSLRVDDIITAEQGKQLTGDEAVRKRLKGFLNAKAGRSKVRLFCYSVCTVWGGEGGEGGDGKGKGVRGG